MTDKTDIAALLDSAECMANLLDNLAGYEPQDIDMDTVEIRFEDGRGLDTGCDISIVDTAQKSADIIRSLLNQLEAERQRADEMRVGLESGISHSNRCISKINTLEAELASLRGEQEPVAWIKCGEVTTEPTTADVWIREMNEGYGYDVEVLCKRQPKPVVVLPKRMEWSYQDTTTQAEVYMYNEALSAAKLTIEAAGIAVKDGE